MNRRFLFRLDGSKDNNLFFAGRRQQENVIAYSGMAMVVGPGWIPDIVAVESIDNGADYSITLIELDGVGDRRARILPKVSSRILDRHCAAIRGLS